MHNIAVSNLEALEAERTAGGGVATRAALEWSGCSGAQIRRLEVATGSNGTTPTGGAVVGNSVKPVKAAREEVDRGGQRNTVNTDPMESMELYSESNALAEAKRRLALRKASSPAQLRKASATPRKSAHQHSPQPPHGSEQGTPRGMAMLQSLMPDLCARCSCPVRVQVIPGKGRGVVACRALSAGELVETSHLIKIPPDQVPQLRGTVLFDYVFEGVKNDERGGAAYVALGLGSLFNHSATPNLELWLDEEEHTIQFMTTVKVKCDEELTIIYHHLEPGHVFAPSGPRQPVSPGRGRASREGPPPVSPGLAEDNLEALEAERRAGHGGATKAALQWASGSGTQIRRLEAATGPHGTTATGGAVVGPGGPDPDAKRGHLALAPGLGSVSPSGAAMDALPGGGRVETSSSPSMVSQLRELKALADDGILTPAEFRASKAVILGLSPPR